MSENQPTNNPAPDWRTLRAQERAQRRAGRDSGGWIIGLVFVVAGGLLLLGNFTSITLNNWWALFILLPAAGSFAGAWRTWVNGEGGNPAAAIGPFIAGLFFLALTVVFLFNLSLNWNLVLPLALILIGASALVGAFARR